MSTLQIVNTYVILHQSRNNFFCIIPADEVVQEPVLPEETTAETTINCGDVNDWSTDYKDVG